jgi:hypothetical protein
MQLLFILYDYLQSQNTSFFSSRTKFRNQIRVLIYSIELRWQNTHLKNRYLWVILKTKIDHTVTVPRRSPEGGGTRKSGRPSRKGRTVGLFGTNNPKKEAV